MIKKALSNFLKGIQYFFTPLGTLFLGVVLGISVFLPGVNHALKELTLQINELSNEILLDWNALKNSLFDAFIALDYSRPIEILNTITSKQWFNDTLNRCLQSLISDFPLHSDAIAIYVSGALKEIMKYFVLLIFCISLGLFSGYFLSRYLLRSKIAKRALWKFFMISFIDSILSITIISLCIYFIRLWIPNAFLATFLSVILYSFLSLFEAYIVHGWKKIKIFKILNFKNAFQLFLSNLIIYLIVISVSSLIALITNFLFGLVIGIALMEIGFIVISLNAESFVKEKTLKAKIIC